MVNCIFNKKEKGNMKNVITSFLIFFTLILCMSISLNHLDKICTTLEEKNDLLEEIISKEDWDKGYDEVLDLLEYIKSTSNTMSLFINHQEIDLIEGEIFKLTQYVKLQNKDESLASIHVIKFNVENIQRVQKVNLHTIF